MSAFIKKAGRIKAITFHMRITVISVLKRVLFVLYYNIYMYISQSLSYVCTSLEIGNEATWDI